MPRLIRFFIILFCATLLCGCPGKPEPQEPPHNVTQETGMAAPDQEHGHVFDVEGLVVYKEIEGGFFAIQAKDGKTYDPVNLPETFRKDGLRVRLTARKKEDMAGIHMHGTIIEIVDISIAPE
ncbi:hypothetical protein [Desulfoluna butyratoxydans]|uniref:Uncharacterized protein n=1 Tax=Desulfoluna butyratoxydans TaxID=231438 RepID=A0A4U8YSG2_9BACT|nr:hypothetical protein [Desulfoluna butyratoxydans]VFQ46447.1 hypothetical protein MSL71_41110 [Desulfoluna butyratoxydans]